ncbi:thioredoxin domain-containing protein [Carboxylicivirga sp. A043]|uniref:DsbA family protein n=1 Tax=Carboxylicivirga litoralis TaxID=2816963 RepID=UPI0021CB770C|nr:DsbA family protein [Carboxylicivirga sp. A043]MCU4156235.1 thioredoxin domain-containing protein [Carboxylicivirga sp. A043]
MLLLVLGFYITKLSKHRDVLVAINEDVSNSIVLGASDAPETITLFFDYNCRFCKNFFSDVYPQLDEDYIQTGKVKLNLRLVCSENDKFALLAYQTALCLYKFGEFDKLHKLLLHQSKVMYTEQFVTLVEDYIAINEMVGECITESNNQEVLYNIYQFEKLKTKGTPTFVINNGVIVGYQSYESIIKNLN